MALTKHNTSFSLVFLAVATTTTTLLLLASADPAPNAAGAVPVPAAPAGGPGVDLCKDANFVGVCRAAIGQLTDPAQAFQAAVKTLIKNTNNARQASEKLGKNSEVCNEVYEDAAEELQTALDAYQKKDRGTVTTYLSAALSDYTTCEDSWEEVKDAGTPPLLLYNKVLHRMAANCLYFESMLQY